MACEHVPRKPDESVHRGATAIFGRARGSWWSLSRIGTRLRSDQRSEADNATPRRAGPALCWPTSVEATLSPVLLRWFAAHARALPWRPSPGLYATWISEIMLQQTQVATVVPYYIRFLQRFPDVAALAAADEQEVLRCWEGLGYYRRARQLHAAARRIVAEHGGRIPTSIDQLRALPGIGRYTAGAILSIALDQRHPILEANTVRVLSRLSRSPPIRRAATASGVVGLGRALLARAADAGISTRP